jgi:septal ring factor EnvC (AmiA/AmiB activator)
MIDTTINMGSIITIITVTGTLLFTTGNYATKIDSVEKEQEKTVVRVKKTEQDITDLKVTTAKIETKLDERFDRIEDLLMDISD